AHGHAGQLRGVRRRGDLGVRRAQRAARLGRAAGGGGAAGAGRLVRLERRKPLVSRRSNDTTPAKAKAAPQPRGIRQTMSDLHIWAGLLVGWLLYAMFLTGTVSYFKDEISQWMRPELAHQAEVPEP